MAETVPTLADFLAVVKKSGLVDEARLQEACAAWPDRAQPLPDELVAKLVDGQLLTQWQVGQLRKGKHRGFVLGNYKLLKLLGAGGMGSVYLAEHVNLHGKVAIKVLPKDSVAKTSYLSRFEREAREVFRLSHHNILRAIDLDTSGDLHYFVMEYLEGTDLHAKVKDLLERKTLLPIRDAVDYVRQAALGLQYAHEEGVIHRDIKPANLFLDTHGTIKILDFGLALAGNDEQAGSLTREFDEKVLGTADYLAPEQARDSHLADARSDIYSLGCTLYYLLVGSIPFPGGKLAERMLAHRDKPPPNPLDTRPDVPPPIVELYFRMMAKHPEARPQTAKEVADVLGGWLASPAGAATAGPTAPPRRLPPRRIASPGGSGSSAGVGPGVLPSRGSGIGRRPSGSGPLVFTPPGAGAGRVGVKTPAAPVRTGSKSASGGRTAGDGKDGEAPAPREPWSFLGQPLGLWIVVLVGVGLAIGLGVMVLLNRTAPRGSRARDDAAEVAAPADKPASKSQSGSSKRKAGAEPIDPNSPLSRAVNQK